MATPSYDGIEFIATGNGSYNTKMTCTWQLISQSTQTNSSTIRLRQYFYYGGGTHVSGSGTSNYVLDGQTKTLTSYTFYPGYSLLQEKDITVTHTNNGDFPGRNVSISANGYTQVAGLSGSGNISGVPAIKRFASITNSPASLTDEDTFWFSYTNPANASMSCWLEVNPNSTHYAVRTLSGTSGTYTWTLTNEERTALRQQMATSSTGKIRIGLYSTIGGTTSASYVDKTFTIINANPVFSNFEFEDVNPVTLALTGDSSVNVNGFSNVQIAISTANKAQALKEATMSKYKCTIGNSDPYYITYNDDASVSTIINNASSGTYNVYAIDSRNNSTLVTKVSTNEIAYDKVFIDKQTSKVERDDNQVGDGAELTLQGTFWNGDFGDESNSLTITYQLKKSTSQTWIDGTTTITPTISGNNFSFSGAIASNNQDTSWDLQDNYDVKVIVTDELSTTEYIMILNSAVPTMSFDREGVGIMCAYDSSLGGSLQVEGKTVEFYNDNFDEDEINTGKKWIDGKDIYRKVYYNSSPSQTNEFDPQITNVDKFVNIYGMAKRSGGSGYFNSLPCNYTGWEIYLYDFSASHTKVVFSNNQWNSGVSFFYVIYEYTKTI